MDSLPGIGAHDHLNLPPSFDHERGLHETKEETHIRHWEADIQQGSLDKGMLARVVGFRKVQGNKDASRRLVPIINSCRSLVHPSPTRKEPLLHPGGDLLKWVYGLQ